MIVAMLAGMIFLLIIIVILCGIIWRLDEENTDLRISNKLLEEQRLMQPVGEDPDAE